MKKSKMMVVLFLMATMFFASCDVETKQQKSDSGVEKATVKIKTDINGQTIEQKNIIERLERDNDLGSLKHLYVISSFSGDVMEYSTVKGKVTSGGKRLSPKTVNSEAGTRVVVATYNTVKINGNDYLTDETLDDGGAYGESMNYVYWFDAQDNYHQYFPSGGTYLHISDKPLRIKKSNMTFEIEESK
jgi:hypothetical protein